MTKDVFDCMREAHSVHSFSKQKIAEASLTRLIEAGSWAPSAGNIQPWYFYAVTNEQLITEIGAACYNQPQVAQAAALIVVVADPAKSVERFGQRGADLYCLQDTAVATQNIILAAEGLGIDSCWIGAFDETQILRLVKAPSRMRPVAIVCLGYSEEEEGIRVRRQVAEITKILN